MSEKRARHVRAVSSRPSWASLDGLKGFGKLKKWLWAVNTKVLKMLREFLDIQRHMSQCTAKPWDFQK
jgi:hypothetical protein